MYIRDILKRLENQKSNIIFKVDIIHINIILGILGIVVAYFRIFMPKGNDITDRIGKLKEELIKKLSAITENLLVDFYNTNIFKPQDDIEQILSLKMRPTKEYIRDGIRIINVLKKVDEIEQKAERYYKRALYSSGIAVLIWIILWILVYYLSSLLFWINIIAVVSAVIIFLLLFILFYYSRKNLEDLLDCEKRI